jgi:glycosyltransferase involved in cell wall biosynthesis
VPQFKEGLKKMSSHSPLISIITPTFNRSNVLYYTIASVLTSTFQDWEHIVVGDGCTDNTEQVIGSFKDPRIRFINLERNTGFESIPNNEGFRHARGRYIAYLHHDDLWMPYHLNTLLYGIEKTGSDMVFSLGINNQFAKGKNKLIGAFQGDQYFPSSFVPVSLWFVKREFIEEFGPWKHYHDIIVEPGQELLIRAWRAGKKMLRVPRVTVVKIQAGRRHDVYRKQDFQENKIAFERMQKEPEFLELELTNAVLNVVQATQLSGFWPYFRRGLKNFAWRICLTLGITPMELFYRRFYWRKGAAIIRWRKKVGLDK